MSPQHQELDREVAASPPSSPHSADLAPEDSSLQEQAQDQAQDLGQEDDADEQQKEDQERHSQEPESPAMETDQSSADPALLSAPLEVSSHQPPAPNSLAPPQQSVSRPSSPLPKRNSIAPTEVIKEPTVEITPRLVIEKMVLVNFKSYAGRQEIGPFHKSFTSVVGPNGSGKSNVIDALLFVFGYRASKMRQGKLSELIHNSSGAEDLDSCTVEIHFCEILDLPGPDNFERIQGSTLVVARQAFQNNSSKYFVNNFLSSYTAVTSLLKGRGIDLDHKRFLILQGEVESIAQMKAKAQNEHEDGLLEYLEDIIGTSAYKETIEKSAVELEALNDERSERLTRVKYVEKERDSLEERKREAEAFLKNGNTLAVKQSALYQIYLWECNKKSTKEETTIEQLTAKLEEDQNKHKGLRDEIQELESKHGTLVKECEKMDKEVNEILKQSAKIDAEDVKMKEQKKHLDNKEKKTAKALSSDKQSSSTNLSNITNYKDDLVKQQEKLEDLEKHLAESEAELEKIRDSLKGRTEDFTQQIEDHQKELAPWTAQISEGQSAIDIAQSEHDLLKQKSENLKTNYDDAQKALEALKKSQASKNLEIMELKDSIETSGGQIEEMKRKLKEMSDKESFLKDKATAARSRAEEARVSQQKTQSRSTVLNSLMRQRDIGMINGIHGRLGNLGAIDDMYDVAVSTACPALDNIVVDNVEVGQQCVEFVRKNNLGRVSLILLNQLPKRDLSPIQTPENVPRLFDLVRPADPKFAPAFYSVMQDTLVAEDLRQANRIAFGKQRWRVVTLDGQLIDKSGTMTGGGNRVMKGAMSSKISTGEFTPEVLMKLESDKDKAETEYSFLLREKLSLERELNSTQVTVPKNQMRLSMLEMDVQANVKRIADSEKRVEALSNEITPKKADTDRMNELAELISKRKAGMEGVKKKAQSIEAKIKDLQQKILDAGGVRLRAQKAKVDEIRGHIKATDGNITETNVLKNRAQADQVKLTTQISKHEKELTEVSEQLNKLKEEIKVKKQEADAIRMKADEAKSAMEDKKEEMEEMKKELDARVKVINKIRTAEVEMRNQLEDLQRSLAEHRRRIKHWKDLLSELTLQEVDYEEDEVIAELQEFSEADLDLIDKEELEQQIQELEKDLSSAKPNLSVLDEYKKREEEYLSRAKDLEEITLRREEAKKAYDELRKRRLDEFMAGFQIISMRLKEMYQMITLGGNAELELVDSLDPFSEGIIFSVMPPKKSWKNISNLSGGEKTLSSLALVFALHHYKPTPLYVMDEIDAALDFRNVSIVANYIKERTRNAQFVIISLRNNMFELADRLVGIYKTDNKTKSISINPSAITVLRPVPVPGTSQSAGGSNTMHGPQRRMSTMSRHASDNSAAPRVPAAASH
ncbi:hypothetical protein BGX31_000372 [Mortierella sp. GBA43]|nr:hypothetical protein BGX31_000372 [Mortierella sp. GBA43]